MFVRQILNKSGFGLRSTSATFGGLLIVATAVFACLRLFPANPISGLVSRLFEIRLSVNPSPKFSCAAHEGDTVLANYDVTSNSAKAVTLLGTNSTCGCVLANGLPATVSSSRPARIELRVKVGKPESDGVFRKQLILFCDTNVSTSPLIFEASVLKE
jgi:hypothetical protein